MEIKHIHLKMIKLGIYKHFSDIKHFVIENRLIEELIADAKSIIQYKKYLGLLKVYEKYFRNGININNNQKIELIYYISGISRKHNIILLEELHQIEEELEENEELSRRLEVKIFQPYLSSNVIYDDNLIPIKEFLRQN